jgi:hypothetical protein
MRGFIWSEASRVSDLQAVEDFVRFYEGQDVKTLAKKNDISSLQQKTVILRGACQSFWYLTSEPIEQRFIVAGDVIRPWMDKKKRREDQRTMSVARVRVSSGRIDATQPDDPPRGVWVE